MARDAIDIALVQEPWIVKGKIAGLGDARWWIISDPSEAKPRTCILARKDLRITPRWDFCSKDLAVAGVTVGTGGCAEELTLASAYLPYEQLDPLPSAEVQKLVAHCQAKGAALLIGCDANAHHTVWGSTGINRRGELLLQYIFSTNIEIGNVGNEPTFIDIRRRDVIDLTLSTVRANRSIKNWRVSDEPSSSDHRYIRFDIDAERKYKGAYRNPRTTGWDLYRERLESGLEDCPSRITNTVELEGAEETLRTAIINAYEAACPLKENRTSKSMPWWNEGLNRLRTETRRLFNRAKRTGNWESYREALTAYNKALRKAKRDSWRRHCEGIEKIPEGARLQKALQKGKECQIGTLKREDGSYTETVGETLQLLLKSHFPGSEAVRGNGAETGEVTGRALTRASPRDWALANHLINQTKIKWATGTFQPFKTPGMDGIIPALMQKGINLLASPLTTLLRASLALGCVPEMWRKARVVFIPKPGRDTYAQPRSFRPISLTSFLLKLLEKIIERHIRDEVLTVSPLSPDQCAYQAGKSCELAIHKVISRAENALRNKELALGAFIDIEGAFDNTSLTSIKSAVKRRGVHPAICRWIENMLTHRYIYASLNEVTVTVRSMRGCPQGGVLSPLLWCLVVDDLLTDLNAAGYKTVGYADDIAIIVSGKFAGTVSDTMQAALKRTERWCNGQGLSVNPGKTALVTFTNRRKLGLNAIKFYGTNLKVEGQVKYLGVMLDQRLSFAPHLEHITKRATRNLWVCRRTFGSTWGLTPRMTHWIYTRMIVPIITYASFVWWTRTDTQRCRNELGKVQRLACLCITGAMTTTPTAALEVILGLPPLHLRVRMEALRGGYRLYTNSELHPPWEGHTSILRGILENETLNMRADKIKKIYHFSKPFEVVIPTRDDWSENRTKSMMDGTVLYTDGSKTSDTTGYGIYEASTRGRQISANLGRYATVFQSEIYAILQSTYLLLQRNYSGRKICIVTDSKAALAALASCEVTSSLTDECLRALEELGSKNKLKIIWTPGHLCEGNQRADELAKRGRRSPFVGPEPACGIAYSLVKQETGDMLTKHHLTHWKGVNGQKQAKTFLEGTSEERTKNFLKLSRPRLKLLTGLITGHCRLNKHLYNLGIEPDPTCRGCNEDEEAPLHLILHCEAYVVARKSLLGAEKLREGDVMNISPKKILDFIKETGLLGE